MKSKKSGPLDENREAYQRRVPVVGSGVCFLHCRQSHQLFISVAILLATCLGCDSASQTNQAPASIDTLPTTPSQPDTAAPLQEPADSATATSGIAPADLTALEQRGARIKRDREGRIRELDLRKCAITNADLGGLTTLADLKVLKLAGGDNGTTVDDDGLVHCAALRQLHVLALDRLWVSEAGLAKLQGLPQLEELYLAATLVGDDVLPLLAQFPRLTKLRLAKSQLSGKGLAHLAALTQLRELDLSEVIQLADDDMAELAQISTLTRLNLWRVPITDEGIGRLRALTQLEWLNLDNTHLSDAGLVHLLPLTKLRYLHAGSTAITDKGLTTLQPLTKLRDIIVSRTSVTPNGAAELQKQMPQVKIQLEYLGPS